MATDLPENEGDMPLAQLRRSLVEKTVRVTDDLAVLPESQRSRMLLGIQTAVMAGRRHQRRRVLLASAAASILVAGGLGALLQPVHGSGVGASPTPWEEVDLGQIGHLRVRGGSDYLLPAFPPFCERDATRIELRSGALCAQVSPRDPTMADPLFVATPEFVVEVVGTEFCMEAWRGVSVVDVSEGVVRVHAGETPVVYVRAGESMRSDDVRLAALVAAPTLMAPAPSPTAAAPSRPSEQRQADCAGMHGVGERRRCYAARALGSDVRAANALYSVALIDAEQLSDHGAAIAELRSYQARFPAGILSPEVSVELMSELADVDRFADAVAEAELFRMRFPSHPRADEVTLMEGGLLLNRLGRPADAASVYRTLLGRPLTAAQRKSLDAALRRVPPSISLTPEGR
jgi:hypothetical protein